MIALKNMFSYIHGSVKLMTKVVNKNKDPYDIYIGRGSKWGNPYSHKESSIAKYKVSSRKEAIESFERYITMGEGKHLLQDLHELEGKTLGCFCKPQSCHGDILVRLVNEHHLDLSDLFL